MGVRSSMLELAILGELEEPLHGYEVRKRLSRSLGPVRSLSFGSLYPALHRLADQGLITVVDLPKDPAESSDAGGKTGKATSTSAQRKAAQKKSASRSTSKNSRQVVYQITLAGSAYLHASLEEAAVDDESMPLTVALMSQASPPARLAILKERRAQVLDRKRASEDAKKSSDFWVSSRGELDALQADNELSWLDRLIKSDQELIENPPIATNSAN